MILTLAEVRAGVDHGEAEGQVGLVQEVDHAVLHARVLDEERRVDLGVVLCGSQKNG